eukprot:jgi/Botrbrau1/11218/Bobra.0075s0014.1
MPCHTKQEASSPDTAKQISQATANQCSLQPDLGGLKASTTGEFQHLPLAAGARQMPPSNSTRKTILGRSRLSQVLGLTIVACLGWRAECQPGGIPWDALADTATYSRLPWDQNDAVMANQIVPWWGSTTMYHTGTGQDLGGRGVMYAGQDAIYTTCPSQGARLALSTCGATLPLIAPFAVGVAKIPVQHRCSCCQGASPVPFLLSAVRS